MRLSAILSGLLCSALAVVVSAPLSSTSVSADADRRPSGSEPAPAQSGVTGSASNSAAHRELGPKERVLHALDRFSFGPRPGEAETVAHMGLDRWFEAQLHPASIDDAGFEARLGAFPAMRLPQDQLVARFPSNQLLRQAAREDVVLPSDPVTHAIYADNIAFYSEAQAKKAAAKSAGKEDKPGTEEAGDAEAGTGIPSARHPRAEDSYPAARLAELLASPPSVRFSRMLALSPADLRPLRRSLSPDETRRLFEGMTPEQKEALAALDGPTRVVATETLGSRLERDVYSDRQLEAVMTDFWLNHFNVYVRKNGIEPALLPAYERETIRPHALGRFEDLLVATASSPAMLVYLDNAESTGPHSLAAERSARAAAFSRPGTKGKPKERGLNENYARELMELHTLGVRCEVSKDHAPTDPSCGKGYTQADVTEVAKVLTGWTVRRPEEGSLATYDERRHEPGSKHVLGTTIHDGGEKEGLELLHLLASSPATARFVSTKLAVRFVSDDPPPALVNRMTQSWLASSGDIAVVLRTMFHSPEFWSPEVYRSKVKTPLEFVVSALRASGADMVSPAAAVQSLDRLGMPLYGMQTPNGYSWLSEPWVSTSALVTRMNFALVLAGNRLSGTHVVWPAASTLSAVRTQPVTSAPTSGEQLEQALERVILSQPVSERTRRTILAQSEHAELREQAEHDFLPDTGRIAQSQTTPEADGRTAMIAGLLLGSPEFQRR